MTIGEIAVRHCPGCGQHFLAPGVRWIDIDLGCSLCVDPLVIRERIEKAGAHVAELEEELAAAYEDDHRATQRVTELETRLDEGRRWYEENLSLRARVSGLETIIAKIADWTHAYGSELVPAGVDTYGEGVRDCKARVASIIAHASPSVSETKRREAVPGLSDQRIAVLAERAGGNAVGAPATRDEERAMAVEIQSRRLGDARPSDATLKVDDVEDVLDGLAASIADGEIDYDDIKGPVGAQRAALELLRQVRIGLAIDPSSDRLRNEPAPIGTVTCINCGRSSDDPTGSACPSGGGPQHDWEERDSEDEQSSNEARKAIPCTCPNPALHERECPYLLECAPYGRCAKCGNALTLPSSMPGVGTSPRDVADAIRKLHRRAQKDEGAADRYAKMRTNLEREVRRTSRFGRARTRLWKSQVKQAYALLNAAKVDALSPDPVCAAKGWQTANLVTRLGRLIAERDALREQPCPETASPEEVMHIARKVRRETIEACVSAAECVIKELERQRARKLGKHSGILGEQISGALAALRAIKASETGGEAT